ncbi:MAG: sulfurtransferase [Gammaproteobacteria bacterium]|nr:sulfurtransferase [Gammaproteobacteria bacterium]
MEQLSVQTLQQQLNNVTAPLVLDVREASEWAICHIEGALHIPMGEITRRYQELPDDLPIVVMCHHGMRSLQVAHYLQQQGFNVANLAGGIDAWAQEIDAQMTRY